MQQNLQTQDPGGAAVQIRFWCRQVELHDLLQTCRRVQNYLHAGLRPAHNPRPARARARLSGVSGKRSGSWESCESARALGAEQQQRFGSDPPRCCCCCLCGACFVCSSRAQYAVLTAAGLRAPPAPPDRKMKRLCRRLAVAVAVLVWLGALVYLLVLSRRRLPELGAGGAAGGGEAASSQVSPGVFMTV